MGLIQPDGTYWIRGADLMEMLDFYAERIVLKLSNVHKEKEKQDKWAGKTSFTAKEAAEYLGVRVGTLYQFNAKYNINRTLGRNGRYQKEELNRVIRERSLRLY
ncbi:hypothetical protein H8S95_01025 [Pontibacter sp. KCTC 32443]|uniref:hypothetical protein n=1 Tax=Pontibacter TaxID=323449 RepID=UPI00164D5A44|nr:MULTISPECIES: hypothetical protein [Pontibacter]MBC5772629.1 hypothetical protein [Pontibacter sp. KCTC 32443]